MRTARAIRFGVTVGQTVKRMIDRNAVPEAIRIVQQMARNHKRTPVEWRAFQRTVWGKNPGMRPSVRYILGVDKIR